MQYKKLEREEKRQSWLGELQ